MVSFDFFLLWNQNIGLLKMFLIQRIVVSESEIFTCIFEVVRDSNQV